MGLVYLAEDSELGRHVAIKVVDHERHDASALRRLYEEARAAASLNHPSICSVHELGFVGEEPFIVMEHVSGTLLSGAIPRARGLAVETALHYGMQVVDAVAHAHERGIVHGDLKSANIMIEPDGRAKILDFGLAVHRHIDTAHSADETTRGASVQLGAGTVPYMAPELLRGFRAHELSDIWALGILLFEMLAGRRPFEGRTVYELAASILEDPPLALPERISSDLRRIVRRCLCKLPSDRFASARNLAVALDILA